MNPLLADAIVQVDLATLGTAAGVLSGGITMAAKILVSYFRQRDADRDAYMAGREKDHQEDMERLVKDHAALAAGFRAEVQASQEERRETTRALLQIQRDTVAAVAELKASVASLANRVEGFDRKAHDAGHR